MYTGMSYQIQTVGMGILKEVEDEDPQRLAARLPKVVLKSKATSTARKYACWGLQLVE